jgi:hypothetical protein
VSSPIAHSGAPPAVFTPREYSLAECPPDPPVPPYVEVTSVWDEETGGVTVYVNLPHPGNPLPEGAEEVWFSVKNGGMISYYPDGVGFRVGRVRLPFPPEQDDADVFMTAIDGWITDWANDAHGAMLRGINAAYVTLASRSNNSDEEDAKKFSWTFSLQSLTCYYSLFGWVVRRVAQQHRAPAVALRATTDQMSAWLIRNGLQSHVNYVEGMRASK